MNQKLRYEAQQIIEYAIGKALPDRAVANALEKMNISGNIHLVAIGKAAWQMANAAVHYLNQPLAGGIVLTKYGHVKGPVPGIRCFEGGHPIVDENGLAGTQAILDMTAHLTAQDRVLFLISGGGSALFEKPLVSLFTLQEINRQLLAAGASITEINIVRKRLSAVKGGRFAKWCEPARVDAVILSDVLGDAVDMIASGPTAPDRSTCEDALAIVEKYGLHVTEEVLACLKQETPKQLDYASNHVIGSVAQLCIAAAEKCQELGYETHILTDRMCCEAREAGRFLASLARGGQPSAGEELLVQGGQSSAGEELLTCGGQAFVGEELLIRSGPTSAGEELLTRGGQASAGEELLTRGGQSSAGEELLTCGGQASVGEELLPRGVQPSAREEALPRDAQPPAEKKLSLQDQPLPTEKAFPPGSVPAGGKRAYIAGGECVVHLRGTGLGGRNQELALAAAEGLAGIPHVALFSVGSDGTDGPTDAAGGYVDGDTQAALAARGIRVRDVLSDNDSYHALDAVGGLLKTGPTGTNVNDLTVMLIDAAQCPLA